MSDQEINIAIAEACGWWVIRDQYGIIGTLDGERWVSAPPEPTAPVEGGMPDYCNDLNAIHGAIMSLDGAMRDHSFRRALAKTVGVIQLVAWESSLICLDKITNATARQRAEAFLRAIGKWKEAAK